MRPEGDRRAEDSHTSVIPLAIFPDNIKLNRDQLHS